MEFHLTELNTCHWLKTLENKRKFGYEILLSPQHIYINIEFKTRPMNFKKIWKILYTCSDRTDVLELNCHWKLPQSKV